MSELSEQIFIDNVRFAQSGRTLHGIILPAKLERLREVVEEGEITFTMDGCVDRGQTFLELDIHGWLKLVCQRCLEEMSWPIDVHLKAEIVDAGQLVLVESEIFDEDFEQIPAQTEMNVGEFVEDEILLALPFYPKHSEADCGALLQVKSQNENGSAFTVIAGLNLKSSKEL